MRGSLCVRAEFVPRLPFVLGDSSDLGIDPPQRKDGHKERSSGREVPVAEGERWDKIAAASNSWTC
jgi:hypothetical protein